MTRVSVKLLKGLEKSMVEMKIWGRRLELLQLARILSRILYFCEDLLSLRFHWKTNCWNWYKNLQEEKWYRLKRGSYKKKDFKINKKIKSSKQGR